ncbi:MAG: hypothetical protein ACXW1D_04990 [Halobacteriota archaeon]
MVSCVGFVGVLVDAVTLVEGVVTGVGTVGCAVVVSGVFVVVLMLDITTPLSQIRMTTLLETEIK